MGIFRERREDTMGEGLGVEREDKGGYYEGGGLEERIRLHVV